MNISEIGEIDLIKKISKQFCKSNAGLPGAIGIGDDCAVIPNGKNESILVTTDMLLEDVHFLKNRISPENLGYKSLSVNISDIAAMGGKPTAAFLSIGLPNETSVDWFNLFLKGFKKLAQQYKVVLLGGDTNQSRSITINITLMGSIHPSRVKLRRNARVGDIICITGTVGDSAGGLKLILDNLKLDQDGKYLVKQHYRPVPHVQEGQWLASKKQVTSMMDISDGIRSDIQKLTEASSCGASLFIEQIPVSAALRRASIKWDWNLNDLALSGGEDYVLLSTVRESSFKNISAEFKSFFKRSLFPIGRITHKKSGILFMKDGETVKVSPGFEHFK